jgi:hypothetical protein
MGMVEDNIEEVRDVPRAAVPASGFVPAEGPDRVNPPFFKDGCSDKVLGCDSPMLKTSQPTRS